MSLPTSPRSYDDCYEIFDKALADDRGVKVKVEDYNQAIHLRTRMNYARVLDRKKNMQIFEMGHPMFNASQYDPVRVRFANEDDGWFVFVEKYSAITPGNIISLTTAEPVDGSD